MGPRSGGRIYSCHRTPRVFGYAPSSLWAGPIVPLDTSSTRSQEASPADEILEKSLSQTKKLPQNTGRFWDRVRLLCSHQNINENPKDEQFYLLWTGETTQLGKYPTTNNSSLDRRRGDTCASRKGPENHQGCQIQVSLSWLGFNLARWQDDCRSPGPGSSSRSKQEADLANNTRCLSKSTRNQIKIKQIGRF